MSARYPLEELATVHALGEAGELRGKVVLTPTRDSDGNGNGNGDRS